MSRQRPIAVPLVLVDIVVGLRPYGFAQRAVSPSGSRYAGRPGSPFRIRVSDHPPAHAERHPEVLRSIVVTGPMTKDEIEERCRVEAEEFDRRLELRMKGMSKKTVLVVEPEAAAPADTDRDEARSPV